MNQAHYLELGYEPRYQVACFHDGEYWCVEVYDNSIIYRKDSLIKNAISHIRFSNEQAADKFTADMEEAVNDWDCEDYYDQDDPYQDYVSNELASMKGRYLCSN